MEILDDIETRGSTSGSERLGPSLGSTDEKSGPGQIGDAGGGDEKAPTKEPREGGDEKARTFRHTKLFKNVLSVGRNYSGRARKKLHR
jgi:hypothetical protein